jgi:two-component system sensor histidine kinase UhpB
MHPSLAVLYAEGNSTDAELTRSHFALHAPDVAFEVVNSGSEFLNLARKRRHSALMIAQNLRDLDGLSLLKFLVLEGIDTPVMLLSDVSDAELASQALRLGADDYVPKRQGYLDSLPAQLREVMEQRRRAGGAIPRVRARRILAVEEKQSDHSAVARHLAVLAPHLSVETVSTVDQALAQLGERDYDLVLSEHCPPAIDGFKLMVELRHQGWRTPFILVATAAREDMVVSAFKLGASDYVLKQPDQYAELALRIDLAIDRHDLTVANERAADELSERKRMLAALRESEKQLHFALDAGRVGLWSWHVGTGRMEFSARWKAQIGFDDNDILDDEIEWDARCHPDDLARWKETTKRYLTRPWPNFVVEYRLLHKDRSWRWFILHANLEFDEAGKPTRMLGSQVDITALKQQQAELSSASARLQQLSRRLIDVQERERRHLARELHDEIGQVLSVMKMQLQTVALAPEVLPVLDLVNSPIALLDRLLAQVRSLSLDLRPPLLDDLGLVSALNWLLKQHQQSSRSAHIAFSCTPDLRRCDPVIETACFRIAQEALTNAMRHSSAEKIFVALAIDGTTLRLSVRDDGKGFDAAAARSRAEKGGSLGLLSMHERASLAGGKLTLLSAPGRGTEVEAVFPLSNSAEQL